MPITERTLKRWRKESLNNLVKRRTIIGETNNLTEAFMETQERILKMTQELLDQHLLRK